VRGIFVILGLSAAAILCGAALVYVRAQPRGTAGLAARLMRPNVGPGAPRARGQARRANRFGGAQELLLDEEEEVHQQPSQAQRPGAAAVAAALRVPPSASAGGAGAETGVGEEI